MEYHILDREFRDRVESSLYPFSDDAVMEAESGTPLSLDAFLDIVLYVPKTAELPFYLRRITALEGDRALIHFSDAYDTAVCTCELDSSTDHVDIFYRGMPAGSLVYSPAEAALLRRQAIKAPLTYRDNLPVICGRCFVYDRPYLSVIDAGGAHYDKEICLVAASGTRWIENPNRPGSWSLCVLGEESPRDSYVKSINGIVAEDLWLAASPISDVKVVTKPNEIQIRSVLDG